jgi:hydrogenase maturation protein HypF
MAQNQENYTARLLTVKGLVQGIGFRPYLYRLAKKHAVTGWIENRTDAVYCVVEGHPETIDRFVDDLTHNPPSLCRIESLTRKDIPVDTYSSFTIRESRDTTSRITQISPDIAVCDECLEDMRTQPHRIDYPLINCTVCGPRFSIITALPYDRANTTMDVFPMCEICSEEYHSIENRRFHAQPVACNRCGPHYSLWKSDETDIHDLAGVLSATVALLEQGKIAAIKGTGGYHLACSATDNDSVQRLRERKQRDGKPFAVLFRDTATVKKYASVDMTEQMLLESPLRPVVLVKYRGGLAEAINNGLGTIGALLPSMPFHYLLMEHLALDAIVLTSGNLSETPIVIDDEEARKSLGAIADAVIAYNRRIHNRVDDSVVCAVNGRSRVLRRSRGYVPAPVSLHCKVDGILAVGAELKNCFALGKGDHALVSQHIGNLKSLEIYEFFCETIDRFTALFRVEPHTIACDMHPDYLSTRYARQRGLPLITVQHHHAHIVSCMAEHGIDAPVIGVSFDGTGYGDDNTVWGGEFLVCDRGSYTRKGYLSPVAMPGGDRAIRQPWRMAFSYLYAAFGDRWNTLPFPFVKRLDRTTADMVITAICKGINSPHTSSAGRLFDAVSALIGLCNENSYEAEAAMRLESSIAPRVNDFYSCDIDLVVDTHAIIRAVVEDIIHGVDVPVISARFHNTIVEIIFRVTEKLRDETGINSTVLSGGVFQNRYILSNTERALSSRSFTVYSPESIPANDGGIALGQLVVAAKRRSQ